MKLTKKLASLAATLLLATSQVSALDVSGPGCYDAEVIGPKLITGVCWECVFPMA